MTGRKTFTMDLDVPGALPTMVCRPPTINGTVRPSRNLAAVTAMPGITDVAVVSTGVAVRGPDLRPVHRRGPRVDVTWGPGTVDGSPTPTCSPRSAHAEIPLAVPPLPLLAKTVDGDFTFYFRSNSPLETNCAIADVRPDRAEIWSQLKSPIVAQQTIAQSLGLPQNAVTCHVVQGGGSFGRHLFFDAALEAAEISQGDGQAGQADVAPHRRLPPRPHAPDVHIAGPRDATSPATCSPTSSGTPASRPTSRTASARS